MKILGIGVDIINNKRIRSLINNKKFIERTFGKEEIKRSKKIVNKLDYFAKRFAAKESLIMMLANLSFQKVKKSIVSFFNSLR